MIEVVQLKNAAQIATFMTIEDHVENYIYGTKLEFVQYLCQVVKSKKYLILAVMIDKKLAGYCVCVDAVNPPISKSIWIQYMSDLRTRICSDGEDVEDHLFPIIKKWGKIKGADTIEGLTRYPKISESFGFKVVNNLKKIVLEL